jgi:nucleoside-diphosphate-sugar epimerase
MKILVIGGTGFISSQLVRSLLRANHHVAILTRGQTRSPDLQHPKLAALIADRRNESAMRNTVGNRTFDAVYDMVAYRPEDSRSAVEVFRGRVGRFIHCSTISVYMVSYEVQPPITEDQDRGALMEFFPHNPFGMAYGIDKRACERVLWDAHHATAFPVSMLRATYVCGPGDPSKRDYFWIERILDGGPLLVPGSGECAFQSVCIEDVAQAFVRLLDVPRSIGEAYNVAGEEVFSLNDYLRALGRLLGRKPELVHVDQDVFDALPFSTSPNGDVFTFNTRRTAVFSLDKIKRDLGVRFTPFMEWMPRTIEWFVKNQSGHSVGYEHRSEELAFIRRWKEKTSARA